MNKSIEERYQLCKGCSKGVRKLNCHWYCENYWKYIGAIEQKAINKSVEEENARLRKRIEKLVKENVKLLNRLNRL